jgi:hypothetical protein
MGASADIPSRRGKRTLILGAFALVLGAVVAVGLLSRNGSSAQSGAPITGAPPASALPSNVPAVTPSLTPTITPSGVAASPSSTAAAESEIDLTVQSTPPNVDVYRGADKLGTSAAPIRLRRGEKVKLTFKADGYAPKEVEVTPTDATPLKVTLAREPAAKPSTAPTASSAAGKPTSTGAKPSSDVQW